MAGQDLDSVLGWRGSTVVDRDGEKIGKFEELYLDNDDRPAWAAVNTGLFGLRQTFVPLAETKRVGDDLRVPYDKDHVKAAPNVDPSEQLSEDDEAALYRHYGLGDDDADDGEAPARAAEDAEPETDATEARARDDEGADPSVRDPAPDAAQDPAAGATDTDDAMTRSEEEIVAVDKRRRVRGRARLRKYVVTEHVQKTVPVRREEVRVEYEPADEDEAQQDADAGPADR